MSIRTIHRAGSIFVALVILSACSSADPSPQLKVTELNTGAGREDIEIIRIYNCGGKAAVSQSAERMQSVQIQVGIEVGVSVEVIQAALEAKYGNVYESRKGILLSAPPETHMQIQLKWRMSEQVGFVANSDGKTVEYRRFAPIDVQIGEQGDLGCASNSLPSMTSIPTVTSEKPTIEVILNKAQAPSPEPTVVLSPSPIPSITPFPDTIPGAVLEAGETWTQGDFMVSLKDVKLWTNGVAFRLQLQHTRPTDIVIRYNLREIVGAVDNLGRNTPMLFNGDARTLETQRMLQPSKSYPLCSSDCTCTGHVVALADVADPNVTEVVVTLSQVGNIQNARWRIIIPH